MFAFVGWTYIYVVYKLCHHPPSLDSWHLQGWATQYMIASCNRIISSKNGILPLQIEWRDFPRKVDFMNHKTPHLPTTISLSNGTYIQVCDVSIKKTEAINTSINVCKHQHTHSVTIMSLRICPTTMEFIFWLKSAGKDVFSRGCYNNRFTFELGGKFFSSV